MYTLWQDLSDGTINFEHVTLTVTFDLLLKNFNIGHNFFIIWDKAFIFGMCVPYDKAFEMVPLILNVWPWPWPLTYFSKTLTLPPRTYTMPCGALPDFVSILVSNFVRWNFGSYWANPTPFRNRCLRRNFSHGRSLNVTLWVLTRSDLLRITNHWYHSYKFARSRFNAILMSTLAYAFTSF